MQHGADLRRHSDMITMVCDRCGLERPLEQFDTAGLATPRLSDEFHALDRMRRAPELVCRSCFRPAGPDPLDRMLRDDTTGLRVRVAGLTFRVDPALETLADLWDHVRRRRHEGR